MDHNLKIYVDESNNWYLCHLTSENNPGDKTAIEGVTFTLNCNGAEGDMVYLTDLDYTSHSGHSIAEVMIYGILGMLWIVHGRNMTEASFSSGALFP